MGVDDIWASLKRQAAAIDARAGTLPSRPDRFPPLSFSLPLLLPPISRASSPDLPPPRSLPPPGSRVKAATTNSSPPTPASASARATAMLQHLNLRPAPAVASADAPSTAPLDPYLAHFLAKAQANPSSASSQQQQQQQQQQRPRQHSPSDTSITSHTSTNTSTNTLLRQDPPPLHERGGLGSGPGATHKRAPGPLHKYPKVVPLRHHPPSSPAPHGG